MTRKADAGADGTTQSEVVALEPETVAPPQEIPLPSASRAADAASSVRSVVGRAALIILAATLAGRLLGLFRDMAVANFFGAQSDTDAFFLAYKIPYLLTLMVAGALTATEVMMTAAALLKAANVNVFELGLWQSWSA